MRNTINGLTDISIAVLNRYVHGATTHTNRENYTLWQKGVHSMPFKCALWSSLTSGVVCQAERSTAWTRTAIRRCTSPLAMATSCLSTRSLPAEPTVPGIASSPLTKSNTCPQGETYLTVVRPLPERRGVHGMFPLHMAALNAHSDCCRKLLSSGNMRDVLSCDLSCDIGCCCGIVLTLACTNNDNMISCSL